MESSRSHFLEKFHNEGFFQQSDFKVLGGLYGLCDVFAHIGFCVMALCSEAQGNLSCLMGQLLSHTETTLYKKQQRGDKDPDTHLHFFFEAMTCFSSLGSQ